MFKNMYSICTQKAFLVTLLMTFMAHKVFSADGSVVFSDSTVHRIDIDFYDLPGTTWYDTLAAGHRQKLWNDSTIYFPAKLTFNQTLVLDSVGVRNKGDYSFTKPKRPFKLDFNEYVKGQRLDGLKKLNLQSAAEDDSQLKDKMAYDGFLYMGIAAPRTGFVALYVNGVYEGIFTSVEQIDSKFLSYHFGHKRGELYKAYYATFEDPSYKKPEHGMGWEPKTNEDNPVWEPIDRIRSWVASENGSVLGEKFKQNFVYDDFMSHMAYDLAIVSYDNFFQGGGANIYLWYDSVSQQYTTIPWDYNLSFNKIGDDAFMTKINSIGPDSTLRYGSTTEYNKNTLATNKFTNVGVFQNTDLTTLLFNKICNIQEALFSPSYVNAKLDAYQKLLSPYLANERHGLTVAKFQAGVQDLKDFYSWRDTDLSSRLAMRNHTCQLSKPLTNFSIANLGDLSRFETKKIDITTSPWKPDFASFSFFVKDPLVAEVNALGEVTALTSGSTIVYVYNHQLETTQEVSIQVGTTSLASQDIQDLKIDLKSDGIFVDESMTLVIYDARGQRLSELRLRVGQNPMPNLPLGSYFFEFRNELQQSQTIHFMNRAY